MVKSILVLLFFCTNSFAYMLAKSSTGEYVRWKKRNSQIELYINPNSNTLSSNDVLSIFLNSIESWNGISSHKIIPTLSGGNNVDAQLKFTNDPRYFSNGVVAVTRMAYQENSGVIYNSTVLINESLNQQSILTSDKSLSASGFAYLGDVVTHELGHLMGLSHSEVYSSSMIFSLFKDQHKIGSDDKHGIWQLYETEISSTHTLAGRVVGGQGNPVFGAHVQLISLVSNQVVAGVFTDVNGKFHFKNLAKNDQFILYMDKIKNVDSLDSTLGKATARYCNSEAFVPSFLSSCDSSKMGESTLFNSNKNNDVGDFTIRCSTQVKSNYLYTKLHGETFELNMQNASATHTGYFSNDEIAGNVVGEDKFTIDLRSLEMSPYSENTLRLNFMSNKLGSTFMAQVKIKNLETGSEFTENYLVDPESGKINSEIQILVNLSLIESENNYEITVVPLAMTQTQKEGVFAIPSLMGNDLSIYHLTAQVLIDGLPALPDNYYQDNSSCREGEVIYKVTESVISGASGADFQSSEAFSCSTVKVTDQKGNLFSIMIGFFLIFSIFFIGNSIDKVLSK